MLGAAPTTPREKLPTCAAGNESFHVKILVITTQKCRPTTTQSKFQWKGAGGFL